MSRGGIGKSKKQPPGPPPTRRQLAGQRRAERIRGAGDRSVREIRSHPWLAVAIGTMLLALSSLLVALGLYAGAEALEGAETAFASGIATYPLGFGVVAVLSARRPFLRTTVAATALGALVALLLLVLLALLGIPALWPALAAGIGAGGVVALAMPEGATVTSRVGFLAVALVVTLVADIAAGSNGSIGGVLVVLPALRLGDLAALRRVEVAGSGD